MNELEFERRDKLRNRVLGEVENLISLHEKWVIWNQIDNLISIDTQISSSDDVILDNLVTFSHKKNLFMQNLIRNLDRLVSDE